MGSVISEVECPNCKQSAVEDFYYKTGEAYVYCQECGYNYSAELKVDEEGNYLKDENGVYIYEIEEIKNPYGAYKIKKITGGSQVGSLENEDQVEDLRNFAKTEARSKGVEYIEISRFVDNEIIKQKLEMPQPKRVFSKEDPYGEEDWE